MKLFSHQKESINSILEHFKTQQRVLFCLATGGGKTVVFSFLSKYFVLQTGKKVLILAHREELINQSIKTLSAIGVKSESVISTKKRMNHNSHAYVAMVQTLKNRLKKDPDFLKDVGLIICDECHLLQYDEIFSYYPDAKILGVTATPVVLKKINFTKCSRCMSTYDDIVTCCNIETYEYSRNFTLSEIYDDIIIGQSITNLIDDGKLVKELVYSTGNIDRDKLKIDAKTGDFDNESLDSEFGSSTALFDVVKNYEAIAKDKKTIIFNPNTKINLLVYEQFINLGYDNIKIFDSINDSESRKITLEWFKNTPNAILCNVSVFTTGFDEPTVECIILNRATKSLSLFLQMVGRGGRICDSIYKPFFTLIDGGGNVNEFGKWSDEIDWNSYFFGTNEKPKPKREALEQVKQCPECGLIHARNLIQCSECGYTYKQSTTISMSGEVAKLIDDVPFPDGRKIVNYALRLGKDKNFAWKILQSQILDLFYFHNVKEGTFINTVVNGKFEISIRNLIKQPYQVIQSSELEGGTMRTKAWIVNRIKHKLELFYLKK